MLRNVHWIEMIVRLRKATSAHDLGRPGEHWRAALGAGRHALRYLVHLLFLHLEGRQMDGQGIFNIQDCDLLRREIPPRVLKIRPGCLLHRSLPVRAAHGASHPRCHFARIR